MIHLVTILFYFFSKKITSDTMADVQGGRRIYSIVCLTFERPQGFDLEISYLKFQREKIQPIFQLAKIKIQLKIAILR